MPGRVGIALLFQASYWEGEAADVHNAIPDDFRDCAMG
jgi:hypothetical protein